MRVCRPYSKLMTAVALIAVMCSFQNCSTGSSSHGTSMSSEFTYLSTECGDLKGLFALTYHKFAKNHCARCHTVGGSGKGAFADANINAAWDAFEIIGFSRVSENAVNPGHKSPYTGPQNQAEINDLKQNWTRGLEEAETCGKGIGSDDLGDRLLTTDKKIGLTAIGASKVLSWRLNDEMVSAGTPLPGLTAGTVEIKIQVVDVLGQLAYYISEPRIRNSNGDLHVISLRNMINKKYLSQETTFAFIDQNVYANTNSLLSTGTSVILGRNHAEDTLALSFGTFEVTNLPPPYLGPHVNLSKTLENIPNENGKLVFNVTIDEAPKETVVVTLKTSSATTAKPRRAVRTVEEPYDFFDWDFTFGTVADPNLIQVITFPKDGPLTQTVEVLINDDQRDENDEILEVVIDTIERGQMGTNTKLTATIRDNDAAVTSPLLSTYSKLMTGSGVLRSRCLECHNTVKKEGGYDMTDYLSMTSAAKHILVPGDPTTSEMYRRIRLQGPGRMPLDQSLTPVEQSQIEQWITGGAPNN